MNDRREIFSLADFVQFRLRGKNNKMRITEINKENMAKGKETQGKGKFSP